MKHLFCDLDGTLLKDFRSIDDEDIDALRRAQSQGIQISIATGRLDYEIKMLMNRHQFKGYRLSQNGAVVYDLNDQLVYLKNIETHFIEQIIEALKGFNVILFFQTSDAYYVQERLPILIEFEKTQPYLTYIENKNIYNELDQYQLVTISIWAEENANLEIKKHLDRVLPQELVSYISSKYTIDITSKENSKGNGILHLCEKEATPLSEIAVIGDSYNDISMFELTHWSFVMHNGHDEVKKYANYTVNNVRDAVEILLKR